VRPRPPDVLARRPAGNGRLVSEHSARPAVLLAIVLLALNLRTVIASLPPLLPAIREDLGLSATVAGLLTTLPVLCFGLLAPAARRLAHRVPLEAILVACSVVTAFAAAVRGIGTVAALFAGSLLAGASVAVSQTALPVLIRIAFPRAVGTYMGAYSMALPIGATLGAGLSVSLQNALGGSWAGSLALWSIPAVLAALLWLPAAWRRRTVIAGPDPEPLRSEPLAWSVAVYFGIQSAGFYATLAWLPEILEASRWSAQSAGALLALASFVSTVPAFLVPELAGRRASQTPLLLAVAGTGALGVAGLLAAPGLAPLWAVLIGIGQGGSLGLGLILPVLRARSPASAASLTAMTLSVGYLTAATGPWLLGAAHDLSSGWGAPVAILLAVTLAQLIPGVPATRARQLGSAAA
jgi:MFS transporter, CP family, cyanate transporter